MYVVTVEKATNITSSSNNEIAKIMINKLYSMWANFPNSFSALSFGYPNLQCPSFSDFVDRHLESSLILASSTLLSNGQIKEGFTAFFRKIFKQFFSYCIIICEAN